MTIREIGRAEFDRYGIARAPMAAVMYEEKRWFETDDGALGLVSRDKTDGDWQWMVLKKEDGSYRAVTFDASIETEQGAIDALFAALG